jgi:hypothetical protein
VSIRRTIALIQVLSSVSEASALENAGLICAKCGMRFDSTKQRDAHMDGMCVTTEVQLHNDCFRPDESDFAYFLRRMKTLKP